MTSWFDLDHFFQGFGRWNKSKNEPMWVAAVSYPTTPPSVEVVSRSRDQLAVTFFKPSFHFLTPITPEELTSTQRFFLAPKNVERENLWIPYIFETKARDLRPHQKRTPSCCEHKSMDVFELPILTPMNLWVCFTTFEVESTLEVMKWNTTYLRWQLQVDPLGSWVACY